VRGTDHRRPRRVLAAVAAALLGLSVAAAAPASAVVTFDAAATAAGQAVHIQTATLDPLTDTSGLSVDVDVARADAATDSGGIGAGALVADTSAVGVAADVPGYVRARFSLADRHAPSAETANPDSQTDTASRANAQVAAVVAATTLESDATAAPSPDEESDGDATVQTLSILPANTPDGVRPPLILGAMHGHANSKTVADGAPGSEASASSELLVAGAILGELPIKVRVLTATASAIEHGSGTSLASSCTVLVLTVDTEPLEPIACDPSSDIEIPGVISLEFGKKTTTPTSERIVALTISTFTPLDPEPLSIIELGIAEASASRAARPTTPVVCDTAVQPDPTASGAAEGTVLRLRDSLSLLEADGGTSRADIDEAGVTATPDTTGAHSDAAAVARSAAVDLEALPQPGTGVDSGDSVEVNDAHASAPLAGSESTTIAGISPVLPPPSGLLALSASTLESAASASTDPDAAESLTDPSAAASQSVESLDADIDLAGLGGSGAPIPLTLGVVQSDASSERTATGVHSEASTNAASFDTTVGGTAVSATAIVGSVTADALDAGGVGTTAATFEIAGLTVGGTTVVIPGDTDGDGLPGPSSVDVLDSGGAVVATVEFGMHTTEANDVMTAAVVVDPVVIRVPGGDASPANTVVLGHMEARAQAAAADGAALTVVKSVDIHYDAAGFTPGGETVAPHQKLWYSFCVGNIGGAALDGVVLSDTLDAHIKAIVPPEPDGLPATWSSVGQTLTRPIGTLGAGQEFRERILVEVLPTTALGTSLPNVASASADGVGPTPSNIVTLTAGVVDTQPALRATLTGTSCNKTTRVLTLTASIDNAAGASVAQDAFIDALTPTSGGHTVMTPTPIVFGDLAPGSSTAFQIKLLSPGLPGTDCAHGKLVVRERASDAAGRSYAFD
jgi:hypothetical protein